MSVLPPKVLTPPLPRPLKLCELKRPARRLAQAMHYVPVRASVSGCRLEKSGFSFEAGISVSRSTALTRRCGTHPFFSHWLMAPCVTPIRFAKSVWLCSGSSSQRSSSFIAAGTLALLIRHRNRPANRGPAC